MERFELEPGFNYVRVETKCPHCGMTVSQDFNALVNQVRTDEVKDNSGEAETPLEPRTVPNLSIGWYQMIKARVTFPFTAKEKDSTERNKQSRIRWKFW